MTNYITIRQNLQAQLRLLEDFLPFCPIDDLEKLTNEIYRLKERMKDIKKKTLAELMQDIDQYNLIVESKL